MDGMRTLRLLPLLLLTAGCFFDTREPEQGEDPGIEVEWQDPIEPSLALPNMTASLEAKILTNYGRSFSTEGLEMDPAAEDVGLGLDETYFDAWSKDEEESRMSAILTAAMPDSVRVEFSDLNEVVGDERYFKDLHYEIIFTKGASKARYAGDVDLYFREEGGLYYISKWIDKVDDQGVDPDVHTWCWLRYYGLEWS